MDAVLHDRKAQAAAAGGSYDRAVWRSAFAGIAAGRAEALERLYDLAAERVFGLAAWRLGSTDDAADVVQDVFVRVAERAALLRGIEDPRAWLLAVAHRVAVDHARKRTRQRRREAGSLDDNPFLEAVVDDPARTLDARAAAAGLERLPEAQRETVYLHHFGGCTFAEIGRITRVPTFTAASRYRLGMKKLRAYLETDR
jgi:RNA polymerase sigma-70 factor (ECF subfamily)